MSNKKSIYAKFLNRMKRYAIKKLITWKESQNRKPLIIRGARQVGKTWLMKEFGKTQYKKTIYINFEDNDLMREHFSKDLNTSRIIEGLELEHSKIDADNTLIITVRELAEKTGTSTRTVQDTLKLLREAGLIKCRTGAIMLVPKLAHRGSDRREAYLMQKFEVFSDDGDEA